MTIKCLLHTAYTTGQPSPPMIKLLVKAINLFVKAIQS